MDCTQALLKLGTSSVYDEDSDWHSWLKPSVDLGMELYLLMRPDIGAEHSQNFH